MRNEMHESEGSPLARRRAVSGARGGSAPLRRDRLNAAAVDAALESDCTLPVISERGSRRDFAGLAAAVRPVGQTAPAVEATSSASSREGGLLQSIAEQLRLLRMQQEQITRMIENAEQYGAATAR